MPSKPRLLETILHEGSTCLLYLYPRKVFPSYGWRGMSCGITSLLHSSSLQVSFIPFLVNFLFCCNWKPHVFCMHFEKNYTSARVRASEPSRYKSWPFSSLPNTDHGLLYTGLAVFFFPIDPGHWSLGHSRAFLTRNRSFVCCASIFADFATYSVDLTSPFVLFE